MLTIWNTYVQTIKHQTLTERKFKYQLQIITQESLCLQNIWIQREDNIYNVALCNTKMSVHISREGPGTGARSHVTVLLRLSSVVASKASTNWAIYHNICMRYTSTNRNYGSRNQLQRQVNCIVFNISCGQNEKQQTNDFTTNDATVKYPEC